MRSAHGNVPKFLAREQTTSAFLRQYGSLFGIRDASRELSSHPRILTPSKFEPTDEAHLVYDQHYQGIPVFGGELRVHLHKQSQITSVHGSFIPAISLDSTTPSITGTQASEVALKTAQIAISKFHDGKQTHGIIGTPDLMIVRPDLLNPRRRPFPSTHLAYRVTVASVDPLDETSLGGHQVFVDAHSGKVLESIPTVQSFLSRRLWNESATGPEYWTEGQAFPTDEAEANTVLELSLRTYVLFNKAFGYDSWDGKGATMQAVFHYEDSKRCPTSFWNGSVAFFCQYMAGDDVVAHEWVHAYSQTTHNLISYFEPGALNEATSDIFGESIDYIFGPDQPDANRTVGQCSSFSFSDGKDVSRRWLIGEYTYLDIVRDMYNPDCYNQPPKTSSYLFSCGEDDSGGIHKNSGVPNHAFALLVDGGVYNGITVKGIGRTKALHIYWRAMSVYQRPTTGFAEHADALEASCADLVRLNANLRHLITGSPSGEFVNANDCEQVRNAMAAVEMRDGSAICDYSRYVVLSGRPPKFCKTSPAEGPLDVFYETMKVTSTRKWDITRQGGIAEWEIVDLAKINGESGKAFFASNPSDRFKCIGSQRAGVTHLTSPSIELPKSVSASMVLSFEHIIATEPEIDGGLLAISVNSGSFQPVPTSAFTFNKPNQELQDSDNPLAGSVTWSGMNVDPDHDGPQLNLTQWARSFVDLTEIAQAGDTIRLRFSFGQDGCTGVYGWLLRNIRVFYCSPEGDVHADENDPLQHADDRRLISIASAQQHLTLWLTLLISLFVSLLFLA